jgi:competence CoiA-like predicted nuclease
MHVNNGIMPGRRLKKNPDIINKVLSLQASGLPYKDIAKETNISLKTAWRIATDEDNKKKVDEYRKGFYYSFLDQAIKNWESFLLLPHTTANLPIVLKATERTLEGATILSNRDGTSYITNIYNQQNNLTLTPLATSVIEKYMPEYISTSSTHSLADPGPDAPNNNAPVDNEHSDSDP